MMKSSKSLMPIAAALILVFGLSACEKKESTAEKGPAEKAGQQVDQATAKAATEINKMAEKAGNALEKAGESLKSEAREAQSKNEQKGATGTESK